MPICDHIVYNYIHPFRVKESPYNLNLLNLTKLPFNNPPNEVKEVLGDFFQLTPRTHLRGDLRV